MIRRLFWAGLLLGILDLYLLYQIGCALGVWAVLGILILPAYFGLRAVMRQGMRCLSRIGEEMASGRNPSRKVAEAPVILVSGILLLMPGPLSTLLGLLLMIPGVRRLVAGRFLLGLKKAGVVEADGATGPDGGVFVRVVQIGGEGPGGQPAIKDADGRDVTDSTEDPPKALPGPPGSEAP